MIIKKIRTVVDEYNLSFPEDKPFTTFDIFVQHRGGIEAVRRNGKAECFLCNTPFTEKQDLYSAHMTPPGLSNKLFCKHCYEECQKKEADIHEAES